MRRFFVLLFALMSVFSFAQQKKGVVLRKDPFFKSDKGLVTQRAPGKILLKHADSTSVRQDLYEGNPFFQGNVEVEHEGSILKSDLLILYQKDNFARAIGHVDLTNPDGTHLTADNAEYDGNTKKAKAWGNVVLTDPQQVIKTDTLYYDRNTSTAFFNDGGTIFVKQNNSVITTKLGTYFVKEQRIVFDSNYKIVDADHITEGVNVNYLRGEGIALFHGPTTVRDRKNLSNYVFTEEGKYNMNTKEVYLDKNSMIHYNGKTLTGDTMFFNQNTGFGTGTGHVKLDDPAENRQILGGYGEIYEKQDSAMITQKPYAIKIFEHDSAYIAADKIIAYQKIEKPDNAKKSFLRAYKQARLFKTNIQGRADSLAYNETDGVLHFVGKPIVWAGEKQVTGDTIRAYSEQELQVLDSVRVVGHAFAISKVDSLNLKDEFNQVKGNLMTIYLKDNNLQQADVQGNAISIIYVDNQDEKTKKTERIGINYSTCGIIKVGFEDKKVNTVDCEIGALSDTYPMSMVSKEKRFFPDFDWNTKDRLQKWEDIFLDSPNYPPTKYISENPYYQAAQELVKIKKDEQKSKEPQRKKKE